jgi:acyl transferase domain-containing protein/NAD(P)-dependent dehydrogenase (short-subunit alcohol dehydrogenase family)
LKNNSGEENHQAEATPLAIVGIGCLFPQAEDKGTFWTNIKNGTDAIIEVPESHWRSDDYFDPDPKTADKVYAKYGGFLAPVDFNPMEYGVLPNALEAIDTSQLLGLVAVDQALQDAGYTAGKEFDRDRVSVILGVTGTLELVVPLSARLGHPRWREALKDAGIADAIAEDVVQRISDSYVPWQENSFPGLLGNVVAGRISKHFDFGGTNCVVDAACGSSLSALNLAALELAAGKSDMVVTGGIDTFNDIFMYTCFSKTPALSPSGHARPFADDADGTTLGEGLGILVIKRLADAERDGDKIYAVIKGIGASSDGRGSAIYEPSAAGQQKALRRAYQQAGVDPRTIELIEAHGTGTKVGDAVEVSALQAVFGEAEVPWCAIGSIKSQIGHTKAAAGSAGLIKAAMALYNKTLPPTIKVKKPQESVTSASSPFYVNTEARPWIPRGDHPRRAGISALGFGGSNFHCLLEEYQPLKAAADWQGDVQIVAFSAADESGLAAALEAFPAEESWNVLRLAAGQSRSSFDARQTCRLVLVLEKDKSRPAAQIQGALNMLRNNRDQSSWSTPDGSFFARGESNVRLAMLFPGQGAQYPGMLRDLAIQFPQFLETFTSADRAFLANTGGGHGRLSELVYPRPGFDQATRDSDAASLQATDVAQPALGAVSLGAHAVLAAFGVTAEAYAGHSYGELTALCCGGYFDAAALHALSRLRGELMAAGPGDRGSMLAVSAPLDQVEAFLKDSGLQLVLANRNTPEQGVLSGATAEIQKAAKLLDAQGLRFKQLAVAAAFHSELVADASGPFAERLQAIAFNKPTISVFANTTGAAYPESARKSREILAAQLACPVDFVAEIEAMYAAGMRTFLEVGPGSRLTGMVKAILGERGHQAIAIDASSGKRSGILDLGRALAQLTVIGCPVDLTCWDEGYTASRNSTQGKKPGMTISLTGANHFKRPQKRPPVLPQVAANPATMPVAQPNPVTPATGAFVAANGSLQAALQITRQSMQALQNLQEQTSRLHQQFLAGQESATRSFLNLVEQQNRLLQGQTQTTAAAPFTRAPSVAAATIQPAVAPSQSIQTPAVEVVADIDSHRISSVLLDVIAEKTGYPQEMLELEMTLDTDLGIDSIKRVEILSALQEKLPEAPAVKPEDLGVLQTLGQIVEYLAAGFPAASNVAALAATGPAAVDSSRVASVLLEVIAEKTGYPQEMLELEMTLDTDLGIDSIKRVEILSALQEKLPEAPAVKPEDLGVLQTLGQIVAYLAAGIPAASNLATLAATGPAAVDSSRVASVLLEVIAEKTGYPQEMLELEMALDTDLGIDSIKRVEILSALQERLPEAPAIKPEDLGVLQTLGQIVNYLAASGDKSISPASPVVTAHPFDRNAVATTLLEVIADKTGYPIEMLELEMALDTDLGIDSIKRVEILSVLQDKLPGAPAIKPEHLGTLQTVGQIVDFLASVSGATEPAAKAETPFELPSVGSGVERKVLKAVPLHMSKDRIPLNLSKDTVIWVSDDGSALADALCQKLAAQNLVAEKINLEQLNDLVPTEKLSGLVLLAPQAGADDLFLQNAFRLLQLAEPALNAAADKSGAVLATVSRLNGRFALPEGGPVQDVLSGGLAGLSKTAGHEWPEVTCRVFDLSADLDDIDKAAAMLVTELLVDGEQEVGFSREGLYTLSLVDESLAGESLDSPVSYGDVVVISGGARGVTAEVAIALAASSRATLLLLGRSEAPQAEPAWLNGLTSEAEIKKAVIANSGGPVKPREVGQKCQEILGNREIRNTLQRIKAVGGQGLYRSVDLRDGDAVATIIQDIREEYGPIKGLIHGAGVLADRLIKDKTAEQFALVYSTKVVGLRNLLAALEKDEPRFMVMFSSSTGRYGRTGQVDYAVANEILNKMAQEQAGMRSDCRVLSLNWGPWDGGMVTPALKKVFAEEGIAVIDLKAGADYLIEEMATPCGGPVELVILGGRETAASESPTQAHENIYVSKAFDLEISIEQYPFLKSHVIDGKAVLPMAVIIEWMAHAAIHNNPGLRFHGFNDLRVLKGITLEQGQTHTLQVMTGKAFKSGGVHVVPVELSGITAGGQQFVHSRARMVLAAKLPESKLAMARLDLPAYSRSVEEIYQPDRLFHGPDFHGIREVVGCSADGITSVVRPAPSPAEWINQPLRSSWLADPLALDSSFQMMILWSFERYHSGSLPVFAGRYRQYQNKFPESGVEIRVRVTSQSASRAAAEIDFVDPVSGTLIARIEDYECVIDASLNASFQRNKLQGAA